MADNYNTLCIDVGTYTTKVGYNLSPDKRPSSILFTKMQCLKSDLTQDCVYFNHIHQLEQQFERRNNWKTLTAVEGPSVITNWGLFTELLHHVISENDMSSESTFETPPLMMSEWAFGPKANREKQTEIAFEVLDTPQFYLGNTQTMGLYASGRITGVVLDIGHTHFSSVPIYEGYALPHAILTQNIGGQDITGYVHRHHSELSSSSCINWKHHHAKVSPDPIPTPSNRDGTECGEILFHPAMIGSSCGGVQQQVYNTIMKCDCDVRKELYSNIVLQGGSVHIKGLSERLAAELENVMPMAWGKTKCLLPDDATITTWQGMSILSSLDSFQSCWIMKAEYDEVGPSIVHRKCF
eukprot:PhF_6_TR13666/c0_g1_i2/m.21949/K10355/ACTF; actin, other eukaryote